MYLFNPTRNIQQELVEKLWIHLMSSDENYGQQPEQRDLGIKWKEEIDSDTSDDEMEENDVEDYKFDKESPFSMYGGDLIGLMKQISLKDGDSKIAEGDSNQINEQSKVPEDKVRTSKVISNAKNIIKSENKLSNQSKESHKSKKYKNNKAFIRTPIVEIQRSRLKNTHSLDTEKDLPQKIHKSPQRSSKSSSGSHKLCLISMPPSRFVSSKSPPLQRVWRPSGKTEIRVHGSAPSNSGISAKKVPKLLTKQQSLDITGLAKQKSNNYNLDRKHSLDTTRLSKQHINISKLISLGRTHSLDKSDRPILNIIPEDKVIKSECQNKDKNKSSVNIPKASTPREQTETPKISPVSKVLEDSTPSSSSQSNNYTCTPTDSESSEKGYISPLLENKDSTLTDNEEDNSIQTNPTEEKDSTINNPYLNVRLEACLKDAVVDVLAGLPVDWLHSPDNTTEVFLFFMSALESFPRPHYTLKQVLSAIIQGHENTECGKPERGEASCLKTAHLLLYIGVKLCAVDAQQYKDPCDAKQEQADVKCLLLKMFSEIRRCEGSFDRLMLCTLLGSRAPGRGCGWHCETDEEQEKVRDLTYIFANIGDLDNCSVVDLVSEPIWSLGSSPLVVAALADAPELLLVLLQHGAGESQQQNLTYKADPIKLSIAFVVRKLASIERVRLATELQPPKPGIDLFQHTVNTPMLMCLRYLLRTVPWVSAKYLNQHVTGSIRDVSLVLPGVYLGLDPPTLKHLARCRARSSLRIKGNLPYGLEQFGLPATLKDYVNLLK